MPTLKILMCNRPVPNREAYGDWVQLLKTREALLKLGYSVDIDEGHSHFMDYDIIHLFNLNRLDETYSKFLNAKHLGKKIILSSIWHPIPELRKFYAHIFSIPFFPIWIYLGLRESYYAWKRKQIPYLKTVFCFRSAVREIVEGVDCILPNSLLELEALKRDLGISKNMANAIVPNAVNISATHSVSKEKIIVCAGRIGPAKNQISLCQAFLLFAKKHPEYKLIFIGPENPAYPKYFQNFQRYLDPEKIFYRGSIPHAEALNLYAKAEISVLPSFFETTGLSALEALAAGAKVVITECGFTRAYFKEHAHYCDPYQIASIQEAMEESLLAPAPILPKDFFVNLSWKEAALKTAEAYKNVLSTT